MRAEGAAPGGGGGRLLAVRLSGLGERALAAAIGVRDVGRFGCLSKEVRGDVDDFLVAIDANEATDFLVVGVLAPLTDRVPPALSGLRKDVGFFSFFRGPRHTMTTKGKVRRKIKEKGKTKKR